MRNATFTAPDLTTFCRLDELGLVATDQHVTSRRAVIGCRVVEPDDWCHECGCHGLVRDTVVRELSHEPLGWRPTILQIRVRRYKCFGCGRVWRQDTSLVAEPRARLSRRGLRWALEGIVVQHLTMARVAEGLGVAWNTANTAVLAEGRRRLIGDPGRFDGVRVIGVDEHVWRHTRHGDRASPFHRPPPCVRGRALDWSGLGVAVPWSGRPASWLGWSDGRVTGFPPPGAASVLDPFHVVLGAAGFPPFPGGLLGGSLPATPAVRCAWLVASGSRRPPRLGPGRGFQSLGCPDHRPGRSTSVALRGSGVVAPPPVLRPLCTRSLGMAHRASSGPMRSRAGSRILPQGSIVCPRLGSCRWGLVVARGARGGYRVLADDITELGYRCLAGVATVSRWYPIGVH